MRGMKGERLPTKDDERDGKRLIQDERWEERDEKGSRGQINATTQDRKCR